MTRLVRFSNNAVSNLADNLTNVATSLSVTSGDGAKFPALSAGQYFMATLVKADGSTEVVKVTARSTDTLTIVRTAEPVAGASTAYAFSAGDRIEARLTAGVLSDEIDRLDNGAVVEALNKSANYTLTADDVTKLVRVTTTSGTTTITLPATSALTDDYDVIVAKVTSDANTVVIARTGSTDLINGATSYTIYNQYQSAWLIADRSTNTWTVISSGISAVNTVVDAGTGSGSATIALSGDPGSKNNTAFFVGGVYQQKSTYSISGTTLTAGGTIASGVGYEVVWSAPLTVGTPSDGTITTAKLADGTLAATVAGLAKMADGFLQATTAGLAKMADGFLAATTAGRAKMADLFVTTAKLADAAVTTAKIADANVTPAKLTGNAPTITVYTSGSGTYTTPANAKALIVRLVGGGGGGQGSASGGAGGAGGATSFGTSLLTANGGSGGNLDGGAGGGASLNSPATGAMLQGGGGVGALWATNYATGGAGGNSVLAGGGNSPRYGSGGNSGAANTGGGGSGGGGQSVGGGASYSGAGGGSGGYVEAVIASPAASYSYSVGAGGTAGAAGAGGVAGGAGGSGVIVVTTYF